MKGEFNQIIDSLPGLLEKLTNSRLVKISNLQNVPKSGIYVFYENEKPLFVGRSDNMRTRIITQGRQGSDSNSAHFAFLIAKTKAIAKGMDIENMTRKQLEITSPFKELFTQSKKEVAQMSIRCVAVEDPIIQTIFQVYAAMELDTPYNKFETH